MFFTPPATHLFKNQKRLCDEAIKSSDVAEVVADVGFI
jgi:hypothetical protein